MKKILSIFKTNSAKENYFVIPILLIFAILSFFVPAFSAHPIFNFITIGFVATLCILILIWKFLFDKIQIDTFFFLIVLFNLAIVISNVFNKDASHIITYVTLSGMAFCLYQFFLDKKYRKLIHIIIFIGFTVFALYFIIFYRSILLEFSIERIGDQFDNINTVAYYFLYGFVASITLIKPKKIISFLLIIPSLVFVFLIYRTGSRSALILAIICLLIIPFHMFRDKKRLFPFLIDFGFIVFGIIAVIAIERILNVNIFSRLGEFFDALKGDGVDYSSANRIELVFQSFELFLRKPVFGWGNNVFSIYSSERLFAHNNITELLCDFGLFGFIPFEAIIIISLLKIKRSKKFSETTSFALLLVVSFFGIQFFYVNSQLKFDWVAIAFFASEGYLLSEERIKNIKLNTYFAISI